LRDRIFVFTPKGEIVDLPQSATVLDFAYAIHSDIGNHYKSAYVNGVAANPNITLTTGDTIEIETSDEVTPDLSWLKQVKTARAMEGVRAFLKRDTKEHKIQMGKRLLMKVLERMGKDSLSKFIHHKKFHQVLRLYNLNIEEPDGLLKLLIIIV